ncbi:MAG TPA: hypothetical protein VFU50_04945 [Terriglobales bacterium]|nr:hypothetical protein [Terriglobales bacterium]
MHEPHAAQEKCGNIKTQGAVPEALIERMKLVFRTTHGTEMTEEDRNFLGIPPCSGECCP